MPVTSEAVTNPSELSLKIRSHVDTNDIWQLVEIKDQVHNVWVPISDRPASNGTDDLTALEIKNDPDQYLDMYNHVQIRITHYGDSNYTEVGDGAYTAYFNLVQCNVLP